MGNDRGDRGVNTPRPQHTLLGGAAVAIATDLQLAPATERTFLPGDCVGQYEIIRELGRGGMGCVVLARDTRLGRRVAMKFLSTDSSELTARFLVEARMTAIVNHENIVVIYEIDEHDGAPYMVLEYLEGRTLRELLDGTRMRAGRAVEIAVPIVRALVRAHEEGIVHRDLKPENVFVTEAGGIKVLDFGIAKLLSQEPRAPRARSQHELEPRDLHLTSLGLLVGTLPYMSPEQLGADAIDHRSDLWAVGIMLFEMVTGEHPIAETSATALVGQVADLDLPMPRVGGRVAELPAQLERVIDRCLAKRKTDRYATTRELLDELEAMLPGRYGRQLADNESPYPGLTAFQEADADRFFGRSYDVTRMVTRVREQPLVGVVGPSGVGKSSFVRAGVVPALKSSGEAWEVHVLRPGRAPLAGLANLIDPQTTSSPSLEPQGSEALVARLAREPGYFGAVLRARAARKAARILLFVDQFEELYTHVADPAERLAFTACLSAAADDAAAPVRVVVSMRSDFLDRAGEDRRFLDDLTRGLVFLQPLDPPALREALVQPLEQHGYRFETHAMIDGMLATLAQTPGALPLLQFTAAKLWETRDRGRKLLTQASYDAMGGVSGALATHADQVLATLAPAAQQHARAVFQRLVTPERTRLVVEIGELAELASDPGAIEAVVDHLVGARLLVVQSLGESAGASVEIVHESLAGSWPTLRRWLDEGQEDAAHLAQLRAAASQWDQQGRTEGVLWRDEALAEARRWRARYRGPLLDRERAFLAAAFALGTRAARVKRSIVIAVIAVLSLAVAGSVGALIWIRDAEQTAKAALGGAETERQRAEDQQHRAEQESARAQTESERAKQAERVAQERLDQIGTEQAAKQHAQEEAQAEGVKVEMTEAQLKAALKKAEADRALAQAEATKARAAAVAEKQAEDEAKKLYLVEKARREAAEKQRAKITTDLLK